MARLSRLSLVLAAVLSVLICQMGQPPTRAAIPGATIGLDVYPVALAVAPRAGRVFVAGYGGTSLYVLSAATGRLLVTVPLATAFSDDARAIAVDDKRGRVFVGDGPYGVYVLDAHSGQVLRRVAAIQHPRALAVDEATGRVFVSATGRDDLYMLDAQSGRLLHAASVPLAGALAIDVRAGRVYVIDKGRARPMENKIYVIDAQSGRILRTIAMASTPDPWVFVPDALLLDRTTGRLFGTVSYSTDVQVIDARTGRLLRTTHVGAGQWTARMPLAMTLAEQTSRVFVISDVGHAERPSRVSVLDAQTGALLRTVPVGLGANALAVDAQAGRVFVTNFGTLQDGHTVSILNAATGALLRTVIVGAGPDAVAVDPRTEHVFVANYADRTVSMLVTR